MKVCCDLKITQLTLLALTCLIAGTRASTSDAPIDPSGNEIISPVRDNYVITDTLSDGEVERRVKFNGVTAKETAVGLTSDKKP